MNNEEEKEKRLTEEAELTADSPKMGKENEEQTAKLFQAMR